MFASLIRLRLPASHWFSVVKRGLIRNKAAAQDDRQVMLHLARHRSRSVTEISSHLGRSADTILAVLTDLEHRGLVKLSAAKDGHVRVAALTRKGRVTRAQEHGPELGRRSRGETSP